MNTHLHEQMTVAQIMERMIAFSEGNMHDIDHLIRVWTYAKTIGELEGLDADTQYILKYRRSHTISPDRPATRETREYKRKTSGGRGRPLVREQVLARYRHDRSADRAASYLVGHHHTINGIDALTGQPY